MKHYSSHKMLSNAAALADCPMTPSDWADRSAKNLADDAESMNKEYSAFTGEQIADLVRARIAIDAMIERGM